MKTILTYALLLTLSLGAFASEGGETPELLPILDSATIQSSMNAKTYDHPDSKNIALLYLSLFPRPSTPRENNAVGVGAAKSAFGVASVAGPYVQKGTTSMKAAGTVVGLTVSATGVSQVAKVKANNLRKRNDRLAIFKNSPAYAELIAGSSEKQDMVDQMIADAWAGMNVYDFMKLYVAKKDFLSVIADVIETRAEIMHLHTKAERELESETGVLSTMPAKSTPSTQTQSSGESVQMQK